MPFIAPALLPGAPITDLEVQFSGKATVRQQGCNCKISAHHIQNIQANSTTRWKHTTVSPECDLEHLGTLSDLSGCAWCVKQCCAPCNAVQVTWGDVYSECSASASCWDWDDLGGGPSRKVQARLEKCVPLLDTWHILKYEILRTSLTFCILQRCFMYVLRSPSIWYMVSQDNRLKSFGTWLIIWKIWKHCLAAFCGTTLSCPIGLSLIKSGRDS